MRRRIKGLTRQNGKRVGVDIVILPVGKLQDARWVDIREDFMKLMSIIENDNC
jgi:RNase P protein component